jgi:mono/diheme cytochrome c family protein
MTIIRHVLVPVVVFALSTVAAVAQPKIEKGPITPVAASDAPKMFNTYCAVCHGNDGKGKGPAAAALTKAPADLTKISERNGGKFPDVKVRRYIEGLDEVAAHGSRDMPMWGGLFNSLSRDTAQLRVAGLADYVKSLQK